MFYMKEKLENGNEVQIDITDDNVYTTCIDCGKEFKVDLVDTIKSVNRFDLYGTSLFCKECADKRIKK